MKPPRRRQAPKRSQGTKPARGAQGATGALGAKSQLKLPLKRGKILYSLLLLTALAGLLPLVFASVQLVGRNRDAMETSERLLQLDQTRSIASQARLYLQSMHNQLEAIARTLEIGATPSAVAGRIAAVSDGESLIQFIHEGQNILSLTVSDRDGRGGHAGYQLQDPTLEQFLRESYAEALSGKTWVSPPHVVEELLDTVVLISSPIFEGPAVTERPRKVAGVVSAMVSLKPIQELVSAKTSTGREVYVVDAAGILVTHSSPEILFTATDLSNTAIVKAFQESGGQASGSVNFDLPRELGPVAMVGTYTAIGDLNSPIDFLRDLGWGAIVQAEEEAVFYNARQMVNASIWTALAAAVLALVLGSVFAGRLSRPIAQLAEGARRLASGDFSQNINVRSGNEIGELATTFNLMTAEIRSYVERLRQAAEENKQMFTGTVTSLAAAIDAKDPYTAGHSERVAHYAQAIARKMSLSDEKVEIVRLSALMHDVGKIGIEDRILGKKGPLTDEEFEIMKTHTTKGAVIMSQVPQLGAMIPGLKYHHENVDGSGYPEGLKGEDIPWTAKIVSVADTFDAMTTNRPYQKAMEINYVLTRMRSFVGKKFEGHIVEALIAAYEEGLVRPDMNIKRVFDPGAPDDKTEKRGSTDKDDAARITAESAPSLAGGSASASQPQVPAAPSVGPSLAPNAAPSMSAPSTSGNGPPALGSATGPPSFQSPSFEPAPAAAEPIPAAPLDPSLAPIADSEALPVVEVDPFAPTQPTGSADLDTKPKKDSKPAEMPGLKDPLG